MPWNEFHAIITDGLVSVTGVNGKQNPYALRDRVLCELGEVMCKMIVHGYERDTKKMGEVFLSLADMDPMNKESFNNFFKAYKKVFEGLLERRKID